MIDLKVAITKEQLDELSECGVDGVQASVRSHGCTMTIGSHETKDEHVNVKIERKNKKPQPRVKVEYVKVTDSIFSLSPDFEAGELFTSPSDTAAIKTEGDLVDAWFKNSLYRKVERPIEWWEDAAELALNMGKDWSYSTTKDSLTIGNIEMTRDQWCDFARIILEQERE